MDRVKDKTAQPVPDVLLDEFESVTDMGLREVWWGGEVLWRVQLFACRGLR
jgi:hypothetical protein